MENKRINPSLPDCVCTHLGNHYPRNCIICKKNTDDFITRFRNYNLITLKREQRDREAECLGDMCLDCYNKGN